MFRVDPSPTWLSFKKKKKRKFGGRRAQSENITWLEIRVMLWRSRGTPEIASKAPESTTETWNRQIRTAFRKSNPAGPQLGVLASRTIRQEFLLSKSPCVWCFVTGDLACISIYANVLAWRRQYSMCSFEPVVIEVSRGPSNGNSHWATGSTPWGNRKRSQDSSLEHRRRSFQKEWAAS